MCRPVHRLRMRNLSLPCYPPFSPQLVSVGSDRIHTLMKSRLLDQIRLNGETKVFHIKINPWIGIQKAIASLKLKTI